MRDQRFLSVLTVAQSEAEHDRVGYIGTGHLLRALSAHPDGVAARLLAAIGVEGAALRTALDRMPPEREPQPDADLTPTEAAKRALEFAFTEARRSDGTRSVGTGHLLLGVLMEGSGSGARALAELGATLERVRDGMQRLAAEGLGEEPSDVEPLRTLAYSRDP